MCDFRLALWWDKFGTRVPFFRFASWTYIPPVISSWGRAARAVLCSADPTRLILLVGADIIPSLRFRAALSAKRSKARPTADHGKNTRQTKRKLKTRAAARRPLQHGHINLWNGKFTVMARLGVSRRGVLDIGLEGCPLLTSHHRLASRGGEDARPLRIWQLLESCRLAR